MPKTHVVHPTKVILSVGDLHLGYEFYGPFDGPVAAANWLSENLTATEANSCEAHPLHFVENE